MGRQLYLADVLRAAGLKVIEVDGWETRGSADYAPEGLIAHDTGSGSLTTSDAGEINVMINGREGLPGPIAQVYLSRTGTWHVVTSGQSNHVRTGWGGPYEGLGNHRLLGIEAQHMTGEPWSEVQYRSYVRGVAAILKHTGWPTVAGHKEHQPGSKIDPGFSMDRFRADVRAVMDGDDIMADPQVTTTNWRVFEGVIGLKDEVDPHVAGLPKERNELALLLKQLAADVAEIKARPSVVAVPVDQAALDLAVGKALSDMASLAAVAKAVADELHKRTEA